MPPFFNFAHRGASAVAPENTMPAFIEALNQGADAIECDLQITRDGVPVVIHDDFLHRTTDGFGMVNELSFKELKKLDAGSWFHKKYTGVTIPSLAEVLEWLKTNQLGINIELKSASNEERKLEEKVIDLLHQYHMKDRSIISSYDLRVLQKLHKLDPKIETAYIYFFLNEPWKYAEAVGAGALHVFFPLLNEETIQRAKERHIQVIPYTVDEWSDIRRLIRLDISGIITNYPNRVRKYLNYT